MSVNIWDNSWGKSTAK